MTENQKYIKEKIQEFVKKFYLNKLYKGLLLFVLITALVFILYTTLEYFSYLNSTGRIILFYSYLIILIGTLFLYIFYPLYKLLGLGKQIDNETIAYLIGKYFPQIDDKLLNIFQLEELKESGKYRSYDLLISAIDTKIDKIKPFPFIKAIPFQKTKKYIKWALIPVIFLIAIFTIKSEIITESTKRIVQYNQTFEKPAPYQFEILNASLITFQNQDYTLNIKVNGDEVPNEVFIQYGERTYKCEKESNSIFHYSFTNLQRNIDFQIITEEVTSKNYEIKVLPKPITVSYTLELKYPGYLNKNNEIVENAGDVTVPEGTKVTWKVYTKNTEHLYFIRDNSKQEFVSNHDLYSYNLLIKDNLRYSIVNSNQFFTSKDSLTQQIAVIKDLYPEIYVESQQDSLFADRVYFKGTVKDDYGFKQLKFVYTKKNKDGALLEENKSISIPIMLNLNIQDFYYYFDASVLLLEPGQQVEYYFEIFDNDGVNGSKSTKTQINNFKLKTEEEIQKEINKSNNETKDDLQKLIKESEELVKNINKFQQQLMQNNQMTWQDKKRLESLMDQYNNLKEQIQDVKSKQEDNKAKEERYKNISEEILKKQEELMKRFDTVLSDEIKNMLQKMQDMMNNMNKDQLQKEMENFKMNAEDINKQLDQQLELFKLLEFEKRYQDVIDQTRGLSQEQKQLSQQVENKSISKEELNKKQEEINQKFDQLQKELKDLQQLNKGMEDPIQMKDHKEQQDQIQKDINDAKEQINKNNRSKAKDKQQSASDKMNQMADEMEQEKNEAENEDIAEDIESLRQIMDNLIRVSFKQEENLKVTFSTHSKSAQITDVIRTQKEISDYMKMIEDSLTTLAKRQTSVQPFIQKEVQKIQEYLKSTQTQMGDRLMQQAAINEQFALTSMNNLTLMLAESMKEMKQKQKESNGKCNKKGGNSSCSKPGGKKSKPKTARELQQQLNRQMESLKRSMEQNSKQQGQTGKPNSFSEQFAKMAAQQEAIRKMLQDYNEEIKRQNGVGDKGIEQMLREMEATEKDLVNRIINQQTINRQKNIETRLLESERAEMQREKEEKRESTEAKERYNPNPPKEWNFKKEKQQQMEMIKSIPPTLQYYYKEKANQYFYNIE
ncbi:MAG TPA: hypothetical protein PKG88_02310 [Bacteroidales bacterium]|nr:hypothetical protein [Bacteroidales bacterium]HPS70964.1 hypothetical protein [Bacteroidales bacterium]